MITKTSLTHPTTIANIKMATMMCLKGFPRWFVKNNEGQPFLVVSVVNGTAIVKTFLTQQNVTNLVREII